MSEHRRIKSETFVQALHRSGVVPDPLTIRRVVIDAQAGNVLLIYLETFGDERILDVALTLEGVKVTATSQPSREETVPDQPGTIDPETVRMLACDIAKWGTGEWKPDETAYDEARFLLTAERSLGQVHAPRPLGQVDGRKTGQPGYRCS